MSLIDGTTPLTEVGSARVGALSQVATVQKRSDDDSFRLMVSCCFCCVMQCLKLDRHEGSRCVGCPAESLDDAGNDHDYSSALTCVRDKGDFSAKGVGHAANYGKTQT
jgi:hypothetical protein